MKRIISLLLALFMMISCAAVLGGCSQESSKDWPVTVGDVTIDAEPKNIVVLSDAMADIISYIGYDIKMVGRSAECDQDYLYIVPVMGSAAAPDVNAITAAQTDLVIADNNLSSASKTALESAGLKVLVLKNAENEDQLKTLYTDLGTALGGKETGAKKGEKAYNELFNTLRTFTTVSKGKVQSAVYLYMDERDQLCTFTKGTLQHKFFGYCGGTNVLMNQTEPVVNESDLRIYSPAYIFYDSPEVIEYLKNNEELDHLTGLVNEHTMQIPKISFFRYGTTIEKTVFDMLSYIEKISKGTPDEATPDEATTPASEAAAAEPVATEPIAADAEDLYAGDEEIYE